MILKKYLTPFLNILIPHTCLGCRKVMPEESSLCPECWKKMDFLSTPFCPQCAQPFEVAAEQNLLCGKCLESLPAFSQTRALWVYNDASKSVILRFKHADATYAAPTFAKWLRRAGHDILHEADYLIPVPLHWTRLFKRKYNQAALLANCLSKETKIPCLPHSLKRIKATPPQGSFSFKERQKNTERAFFISSKEALPLQNKCVILIDDVMTSGSTVSACAATLLKSGVQKVYVLVLARALLQQ
jgi:ComF family protein